MNEKEKRAKEWLDDKINYNYFPIYFVLIGAIVGLKLFDIQRYVVYFVVVAIVVFVLYLYIRGKNKLDKRLVDIILDKEQN